MRESEIYKSGEVKASYDSRLEKVKPDERKETERRAHSTGVNLQN